MRRLHPHAKRALLIDWGDWGKPEIAESILNAVATGRADYYVLRPVRVRDEQFHRIVSEFLHEWARLHSADAFELAVVADPASPRTHELRDLLRRSGVPHGFVSADSPQGRELCEEADVEPGSLPLVRMHDGRVLHDPRNEELVRAFGVSTGEPDAEDFDLMIVGAGGRALGGRLRLVEGLRTLVIERDTIGGQAGSSSLIRNYLGFSRRAVGARPARVPAGVGLRHPLRDQPRGRVARGGRAALPDQLRRRPHRQRSRDSARHGRRTSGSGSRRSRS